MAESFYRQSLILEHMGKILTFLKTFIRGIFAVLQKVMTKMLCGCYSVVKVLKGFYSILFLSKMKMKKKKSTCNMHAY